MMGESITVQLYPPTTPGLRVVGNPLNPREQLMQPVPCYEYTNVTDVDVDENGRVIAFTNRQGERIESNLPFIVKRETKPEGSA